MLVTKVHLWIIPDEICQVANRSPPAAENIGAERPLLAPLACPPSVIGSLLVPSRADLRTGSTFPHIKQIELL